MTDRKKDILKTVIVIVVMLVVFIDIPIPRSITKHGVTVRYNHFVFNRVVYDILSLDHAAQNNFLRDNAERELYCKLCHKYIETQDPEIAESIRIFFKKLYPTKDFDIDEVCVVPGRIFHPRTIQ